MLPAGTTAATPWVEDNSQKIATTSYVKQEVQLVFTCTLPGQLTAVASACGWVTPAGITITGFDLFTNAAYTTCTTHPTVAVYDSTSAAVVGSYNITMNTTQEQTVSGSTAFSSGHSLRIRVMTAASGSSGGPSSGAVTAVVTYQMTN